MPRRRCHCSSSSSSREDNVQWNRSPSSVVSCRHNALVRSAADQYTCSVVSTTTLAPQLCWPRRVAGRQFYEQSTNATHYALTMGTTRRDLPQMLFTNYTGHSSLSNFDIMSRVWVISLTNIKLLWYHFIVGFPACVVSGALLFCITHMLIEIEWLVWITLGITVCYVSVYIYFTFLH